MSTLEKICVCVFILSICPGFTDAADFHDLLQSGEIREIRQEIDRDRRLATLKDELGRTPLHLAAEKGDLDLVNILINYGADVNATDNLKGFTPMHYAALHNHCKIIAFLLSRCASLEIQDVDGNMPLHFSAANGCVDAVKILLDHQADPNCMNKLWQSPLHKAVNSMLGIERLPYSSAKAEKYLAVARELLNSGAFPTLRDIHFNSPESIVASHWKKSIPAREMLNLFQNYKSQR
ncbi:MAG: hypothetical protein Kow0029_28750 [Candidatus Rifleibacteriota bacterium]